MQFVASISSKPNARQIADQKQALENALGKRFKEQRRDDYYDEEEEEEDDYDMDDGFIDKTGEEDQTYKRILRKVTGYNPEEFDDGDFDDRLMEVRDYETIEREDRRSRAIGSLGLTEGRYEDEEEEEEHRERMLNKKRSRKY